MDDKRSGAVWIVAAVVVLLSLLYVGSYLALVKAEPLTSFNGRGPWQNRAAYRWGGRVAERVFYPVNTVDRWIRPAYWEFDIEWQIGPDTSKTIFAIHPRIG